MSTIKVGIIGCGGIANGKHMPSLKTVAGVEQVAFCDIDASKAEKAAQEYGAQGANVYTSYMDLLNEGGVDVIHVCTPNISHDAITVAALQAGNHVMCEKPMAKTSAGARLMRDVARESGKKLTIGYQSRHRPDSQYLKQLVEDGDVEFVEVFHTGAVLRSG